MTAPQQRIRKEKVMEPVEKGTGRYEYDAVLHETADSGGAYVLKAIRARLNKHEGDTVHVVIEAEEVRHAGA